MKVLLVYPNLATGNGPHFHHGLGWLSAVLRQAGHETRLLYREESLDKEEFLAEVRKFDPGLVGFGFGSHQWRHVRAMAEWLSESNPVPTVAGGPHATHAPEQTVSQPGIDMVCRGEGENCLVDLADALESGGDRSSIANLWLSTDDGIVKNDVAPLIADLETLPFADRELFDMDAVLRVNAYEMTMMAGRGCPMNCSYCCNNALMRLYKGKGPFVRFRAVDNLLHEIDHLATRYRIDTLYFEDDIFTLRRDWVEEFCTSYRRAFQIPFRIYLHVEQVDRDMLAMLKDAGLYMVNMGVESGSEQIRRESMNRKMTNRQIEQVFDWLHEMDLIVRDFNIVGTPGDTEQTVRESMELNRRLMPDQMQVSIFYPYPGTELYERCRKEGYLTEEERDTYFEEESVLNLPDLPRESIKDLYREFCDLARTIEKDKVASDMKRGRRGDFDFLDGVSEAVLEYGDAERVKVDQFLVDGQRRFVLFEHPRARLTYSGIEIPQGSSLRFGIALSPVCLDWGGTGVRFRVLIGCDGQEHEIFDQYIDPKSRPEDRRWHDFETDLSGFAGRKVNVSFLTDPDESGDLTGAWAGWSRPYLECGG